MTPEALTLKQIQSAICLIRGQKVMLDRDLARLYGVPTKALKQAVRRNAARFPADFMFELNPEEFAAWRSQTVTSKADRKGLRYAPMAFTEQGVARPAGITSTPRSPLRHVRLSMPPIDCGFSIADCGLNNCYD